MLDNFRRIYNAELGRITTSALEYEIFNSYKVRAFVYEICKNCLLDEQQKGGLGPPHDGPVTPLAHGR